MKDKEKINAIEGQQTLFRVASEIGVSIGEDGTIIIQRRIEEPSEMTYLEQLKQFMIESGLSDTMPIISMLQGKGVRTEDAAKECLQRMRDEQDLQRNDLIIAVEVAEKYGLVPMKFYH